MKVYASSPGRLGSLPESSKMWLGQDRCVRVTMSFDTEEANSTSGPEVGQAGLAWEQGRGCTTVFARESHFDYSAVMDAVSS